MTPVVPLPQVTAPASTIARVVPTRADHDIVAIAQSRRRRRRRYRSLAVLPTRLLAAETAPLMPVVPLPQVTAPASDRRAVVPELANHDIVAVASEPSRRCCRHYQSPCVPTRLFAAETVPVMPVVPLPQVTAPASTVAPLSQFVLTHDIVAVAQSRHAAVADMVTGRAADQAVCGGHRAAESRSCRCPRSPRRHRQRAVVPVVAAHHIVAVGQRGHTAVDADKSTGRAADQAVGGGDRAGDAGRAVAPGHRPGIGDRAVVPVELTHHIVAVGQRRDASACRPVSLAVLPTRLLAAETTPLMPVVPLAPGHRACIGDRAVVPESADHHIVAVGQRRNAAAADSVARGAADQAVGG